MATITLTDLPLLQSSAQLLILPVSSDGSVLDPILARCKTLYPDNYQAYKQACLDGRLPVGTCLMVKRTLEQSGLSINSHTRQPTHLANIAITDHAYHPIRRRWISQALSELHPKLFQLIRYEGIRRMALLARPLLDNRHTPSHELARTITDPSSTNTVNPTTHQPNADLNVPILSWQDDIFPIIADRLSDLPKARIDIHLPKGYLAK